MREVREVGEHIKISALPCLTQGPLSMDSSHGLCSQAIMMVGHVPGLHLLVRLVEAMESVFLEPKQP